MTSNPPRYLDVEADRAPLAYRLRTPLNPEQYPVVMLHGLSGNKGSMWALEPALPTDGLVVAPRGLHPQGEGGYAWNPEIRAWPPYVSEFAESVERLEALLNLLADEYSLRRDRLLLMGFSNGAAMAFAAAMTPMSIRPRGLIAIAGHLPRGDLKPLREIPIYWGHGSRDAYIPASEARQDVARLESLGAPIRYCEADVGHKLGAECLTGLKDWFRANFTEMSEQRT